MATLHYTSGGTGTEIAAAGFNLADVQSVAQLNDLPDGMKGLVWLSESDGVTSSFIAKVSAFIGNPKLFGFFLVDEPDPTGNWSKLVTAADLKAESDWIHANVPGAKTFITMMDMGSSTSPNFMNTYNPANTHIDYFGLDPYPVRSESSTVDYNMIDRTVAAAVAAGIPISQIVPVFQAFGGGDYRNDTGGSYVLPTAAQEQTMFEHWQALVPAPAFDYAYNWGSQAGDTALENSLALQQVFLAHNLATGSGGLYLNGNELANSISGGTGNDTINGFGGDDTLVGNLGNDTIDAGTGNDVIDGGEGRDIITTGSGNDIVNLSAGGNDDVTAGSGKDTMDFRPLGSAAIKVDMRAGTATLANGDVITFREVEQVRATTGNDTILGNDYANSLLEGNKGNDTINGRGGNDFVVGNSGKDTLTGGTGIDRFDFNLITDSGTSSTTRDVITDFKLGGELDKIDLSTIDAIAGGGTLNDAFRFVTGAFTAAGQVHAVQSGANTIIELNTTGTSGAEMTVLLTGVTASSITGLDFFL